MRDADRGYRYGTARTLEEGAQCDALTTLGMSLLGVISAVLCLGWRSRTVRYAMGLRPQGQVAALDALAQQLPVNGFTV